MSLPRRQQAALDQIDRALRSADPKLQSAYTAFGKRTGGTPMPAVEVIPARPVRHLVLAAVLVLAIAFLAVGISQLNPGCTPGNRACGPISATTGQH